MVTTWQIVASPYKPQYLQVVRGAAQLRRGVDAARGTMTAGSLHHPGPVHPVLLPSMCHLGLRRGDLLAIGTRWEPFTSALARRARARRASGVGGIPPGHGARALG
ncbi:MAG: hypothetical protein ACYCYK_02200 [Candidatus Dormibacteria bacterium]